MSSRGSIFISYRRSDSQDVTRKLYDKIASRFDNGMVFRDLDNISGGLPGKGVIEKQLVNCRVFIAVIGPTWLDATRDGQRRLDNPNDRIRQETEYAFIKGIPIIPVLINGTSIPKESALPGPWLKRLPVLQGRSIRYESDIDQGNINELIQDIKRELRKPEPRKVYQEDIGGCVLEMIRIPKGIFWMGAGKDDGYARDSEKPLHKVNVSEFWMGKYPVTQEQWYEVSLQPDIDRHLEPHPSIFEDKDRPVEQVNWYDAVEFCKRLTRYSFQKKETYPDMQYRLPSEAEWEYACRAGTTTPFYFGKQLTKKSLTPCFVTWLANFSNKVGQTTPVGRYPPNNFGLYDMHGNVWEWCQDDWHHNYNGAPNDGSAWITEVENYPVLRGGSWDCFPRNCRSAYRGTDTPDSRDVNNGFRVVCTAPRILQ